MNKSKRKRREQRIRARGSLDNQSLLYANGQKHERVMRNQLRNKKETNVRGFSMKEES